MTVFTGDKAIVDVVFGWQTAVIAEERLIEIRDEHAVGGFDDRLGALSHIVGESRPDADDRERA
jgi:hypothetical protein